MRFVNDEARSFIARNDERFDVIQISLIDTWAATAAGAFVLSENSLYTVEAWDIFLSHLTPRGLLSVSRWSFSDRPGEVYRMTALATAALQRRGVADPRAHMAIVRSIRGDGGDNAPDGIGTLLVSPSPLDAGDLATLKAQADRLGFQVALDATTATDPTLARLASARDLDAVVAEHPINIAPPTDDSPFFFNMLRLRDVLRLDLLKHGKSSHNMEAVFVLGTLLFTVLLLTGAVHRRAAVRDVRSQGARRRGAARHLLRRHRPRLHAGRDVADAAPDRRAGPPHLRPDGGAVLAAAVERHRQRADQPDRAGRGRAGGAGPPRPGCSGSWSSSGSSRRC